MKQLILEYNKTVCYQQLLQQHMIDVNQKIMSGYFDYGGHKWLIIAKKRYKRIDLTYYDERKNAYFLHHSYQKLTKANFLAAAKLLISDVVDDTLEGTKCKAWYER